VTNSFGDLLVLDLYTSFGEGNPQFLHIAAQVLQMAHVLKLLDVSRLNERSILLIILSGRPGVPVREAAYQRYIGLNLSQARLRELMHDLQPPDVGDLLRIAAAGDPVHRSIVLRVLCEEYLPNLGTCLSRLYLSEGDSEELPALHILTNAVVACYQNLAAADDFFTHLYQHVLEKNGQPLPSKWPLERPSWVTGLGQWEQRFHECSLGGHPDVRRLLFLSFYGRLSARRITAILRTRNPAWRVPQVIALLASGWDQILKCMAT
jgi:hypothetical protein